MTGWTIKMSTQPRPIRVIKAGAKPAVELKENPKLGEIKITKWKKVVRETRKEWIDEHEHIKEKISEEEREEIEKFHARA
jgi:hypothetical protein